MTATLPENVRNAFRRFVTTELTTIDARQQPITWPVTPYYDDGAASVDVTTGLGYPKKANDARANRYVGLLFSDPTGSDIETGIQVLVQGIAEVDDKDLEANRERYARESIAKLPATEKMHPPRFIQRRLTWYYARLYIKVRPERVLVWRGDPASVEPEIHDAHLEEVRSGHAEEPPTPHVPPAGGTIAWDSRIEELGDRYRTAVLSWVGPDGFPLAARLPIELDRKSRRISILGTPIGLPLTEGLACVTAHSHNPSFTWQENFQVRGDLVADGDAWALVPHRLVGGFELPKGPRRLKGMLDKHRRFRRTAKKTLAEREAASRSG